MIKTVEYHNAKIAYTALGIEDHGIFTASLGLEWDGGGVSFGSYALDGYSAAHDRMVDLNGCTGEYIKQILETVGVDRWEQLKGKHVVVESGGWGTIPTGIRNIIDEDRWFRPAEWLKENYGL